MKPSVFDVGSRVRKIGGSYQATGTIRAAFQTRNGQQRYVFDFDTPAGMLHIFNHEQLEEIVDSNKDVEERFAEALRKTSIYPTAIKLEDWFDPYNTEHMTAYEKLCESGCWPESFLPLHVISNHLSVLNVQAKIAAAWACYYLRGQQIDGTRF